MKITTTGVLFSTPLMINTASSEATSAVSNRPPAIRSNTRAPWSSAPVCASPCPITISPRRASNAGLAKPASRAPGPSRLPPSGPASGKMWNASSSRQTTNSEENSSGSLGVA